MIPWLVVADDLSGAAELGAAARRHGLKVSLTHGEAPAEDAEVWVVNTATRDLCREDARRRIGEITHLLAGREIESVFKKVDSVLRGHGGMESEMLAKAMGCERLRVVPGNPARGRTVNDGILRIDGVPLEETEFRNDPHHPAQNSDVRELWRISGAAGGIPTGLALDVSDVDISNHAAAVTPDDLPVGALEFFNALLDRDFKPVPCDEIDLASRSPIWVVCGSCAAWPTRESLFQNNGWQVIHPGDDVAAFGTSPLLIGTGSHAHVDPQGALRILGDWIKSYRPADSQALWCLEGGATAEAVMAAMEWTELLILDEISPGTACLRPRGENCLVLVKPGSYEWPQKVIDAFKASENRTP